MPTPSSNIRNVVEQEKMSAEDYEAKAETCRSVGDITGATLNDKLAKICREQVRKAENE